MFLVTKQTKMDVDGSVAASSSCVDSTQSNNNNTDWETDALRDLKCLAPAPESKITYNDMLRHRMQRMDHDTARRASQPNELWKFCRLGTITASMVADPLLRGYAPAGRGADTMRRLKALGAVRALIAPTFSGNGATAYGHRNEDKACAAFELRETWRQRRVYSPSSTGPLIEHLGLQIARNNRCFACSTDGDAIWPERDGGIPVNVEIKCPAKKRIYTRPVVPYYYYPQLQFMMGLNGQYFSFFCVWVGHSMRTLVVDFNPAFFDKMMRQLALWYTTRYIPAAVHYHNTQGREFPSWTPPPEEQGNGPYDGVVVDDPVHPEWVSALGTRAFVPSPGCEALRTVEELEDEVSVNGARVLATGWRDEHAYRSYFSLVPIVDPSTLAPVVVHETTSTLPPPPLPSQQQEMMIDYEEQLQQQDDDVDKPVDVMANATLPRHSEMGVVMWHRQRTIVVRNNAKFFALKKTALGDGISDVLDDFEAVPLVPLLDTFWERPQYYLVQAASIDTAIRMLRQLLPYLARYENETRHSSHGKAWGPELEVYALRHPAELNGLVVCNSVVGRTQTVQASTADMRFMRFRSDHHKQQDYEHWKQALCKMHDDVQNGRVAAPSPFFDKTREPPNYVLEALPEAKKTCPEIDLAAFGL